MEPWLEMSLKESTEYLIGYQSTGTGSFKELATLYITELALLTKEM